MILPIEKEYYTYLKNEVERLRAEVDLMRRMDEPTLIAFAERDAEIERLHLRLQEAAKLNLELMDIRRNNEAEIERLREESEKYRQALWIATDDKRLLFIENERLRSLLRKDQLEWQRIADSTNGLADMRVRGTAVERLCEISEALEKNQDVIVQNAALTGEVMLLKAEIKQLRTELNRTRDAVDSISDERDIFSRTLNKRDYEVEYLKKLLLESKPFVEFNGVELRELLNTELAKQPGAIEQINKRILDIDLLIKKIENATYEQN